MKSSSNAAQPPFSVFLATTVVIFFLSLSAADSIGFVPDYLDGSADSSIANDFTADTSVGGALALNQLPVLGDALTAGPKALPTRIKIAKINLDLVVQNPDTRDIEKLDELLKNGPARYVDSAKLGETGNAVIFAHSSHLPIVHNQMYKAFNRIPELAAGDSITIEGDDGKSYLYTVTDIHKADATEDKIDLTQNQSAKLTLVTCDTLTSKSSRFVLTADFVGTVDSQ